MTLYSGGGFNFTILEDFAVVEMDAAESEVVLMSMDGGD